MKRKLKRLYLFFFGRKVYIAWHPQTGPWLPSIRGTPKAVENFMRGWGNHEKNGWKIRKIRISI